MNLTRTVAPIAHPITWADCKVHLRLDDDSEQGYVEGLIAAATEYAERETGLALMTQTLALKLDNLSNDGAVLRDGLIVVPNPPLQSVTGIAYLDDNGITVTMRTTLFTVDTSSKPGRIYPAYNETWPSTRNVPNAVTVTYVAGYASAALVPQTIKQAMLILVNHWFSVREPIITGTIVADAPMSVQSLLGLNRHGYQF